MLSNIGTLKGLVMYDYLVVGSGLYGAIFAYEAKKAGKNPPFYYRYSFVGNSRTVKPE